MTSPSGHPVDLMLTIKLENNSQKDWGTVYGSVVVALGLRSIVKLDVFNKFLSSFSVGNKNLSIGVVLYENNRFFNSKQFNSQLHMNRRVISVSLTDKSLLDTVEFAIRPKVSEHKLIMIALHKAASLNHSCYQSIKHLLME